MGHEMELQAGISVVVQKLSNVFRKEARFDEDHGGLYVSDV